MERVAAIAPISANTPVDGSGDRAGRAAATSRRRSRCRRSRPPRGRRPARSGRGRRRPAAGDADRHGGPERREENEPMTPRRPRSSGTAHGRTTTPEVTARAQPEHRQSVVLVGVLEPPPHVCEQAEHEGQRHRAGDRHRRRRRRPDQAGRRRPAPARSSPPGVASEAPDRRAPPVRRGSIRAAVNIRRRPGRRGPSPSAERAGAGRARREAAPTAGAAGGQQGQSAADQGHRGQDAGGAPRCWLTPAPPEATLVRAHDRLGPAGDLELGEDLVMLLPTVLGERNSSAAISDVRRPRASSSRTTRSRSVSSGNGYVGEAAAGGPAK